MKLPLKREVLFLLTVLWMGAVAAVQPQPETVVWNGDFTSARNEAKRTNRPLLVVFR